MLIAVLAPVSSVDGLYVRLYDVVLGAGVGIVATLFALPGRAAVEFRKGVVPVLTAYSDYMIAIVDQLFQAEDSAVAVQKARLVVEKVLQTQHAFFLSGLYERGLIPPCKRASDIFW